MDGDTGRRPPVDDPVHVLNGLRRRIQAILDEDGGYAKVAVSLGVSKGTAWRLAHGYMPTSPAIRRKLGLPETLPPGVQWHDVKRCEECGALFVSNSGKRRRCFTCVPYRDRNHPTGG